MILQPDVPSWKGSKPNSTGGFRVNVCGPCGFRLPDDFDAMTDSYQCPNCGILFEPNPPQRPRRRRR